MKKLFIIALLALSMSAGAQTIERNGNVFVQKNDTTFVNNGTPTDYEYQDKKGEKYTIYLSKNGKAYIVRTSKKTGRKYKQYLPEVTKEIGKEGGK